MCNFSCNCTFWAYSHVFESLFLCDCTGYNLIIHQLVKSMKHCSRNKSKSKYPNQPNIQFTISFIGNFLFTLCHHESIIIHNKTRICEALFQE